MSRAESPSPDASPAAGERFFDPDLLFLRRFTGPVMLVARVMLAYIFIVSGATYIGQYTDVAEYMQANGVDPRLLPLVIATELGGGLLVLVGVKTRWAALALFGFCLLTALFFHLGVDQTIDFRKNLAMAGGFLTLAILGPGPWSLDGWRGLASAI